jgi:hypothetical protein
MLAEVVRPVTAFRDTVKIRDDSIIRDYRNIMDVIRSRAARTVTVEKTATFSRDTSNSSRNSQVHN